MSNNKMLRSALAHYEGLDVSMSKVRLFRFTRAVLAFWPDALPNDSNDAYG